MFVPAAAMAEATAVCAGKVIMKTNEAIKVF